MDEILRAEISIVNGAGSALFRQKIPLDLLWLHSSIRCVIKDPFSYRYDSTVGDKLTIEKTQAREARV